MDTTGKTRAEVDALRELAAKAHAEGAYAQIGSGPFSRCQSNAEKWAAEELPYPTVTRLRVVEFDGLLYRRAGHCFQRVNSRGGLWSEELDKLAEIKSIASLLTRDELLAIANGVCGPTYDVTP